MRRPIAERRVTGAHSIQHRPIARAPRASLHRPIALLYRRFGQARSAPPAVVRAADGRAVPIAPRLQIALHLSLAFNEQNPRSRYASAPPATAPMPRIASAAARDAEGRKRAISRRITRRIISETSWRTADLAQGTARALSPHATAQTIWHQPNAHENLVHFRVPGGAPAGRVPPVAQRLGGEDRRATGSLPALPSFPKSSSAALPPAGNGASDTVAGIRSGLLSGLVARHHSQRITARNCRPGHSTETRLPTVSDGSSRTMSGLRARPARRELARKILLSTGSTAAPGRTTLRGAAPLYLVQPSASPAVAPRAYDPAWTAPPLDYRSPPTPAPQPQPEARPAAVRAPSAPRVDVQALGRDVISRIEKRLRIERERRGRS
ncbi:MAG: hypothetical protein JWP15_553 [Alphaproteobacteria bacterium]|nr:hypothetical protein [Alphaproteobacteria bacterium]